MHVSFFIFNDIRAYALLIFLANSRLHAFQGVELSVVGAITPMEVNAGMNILSAQPSRTLA